MICLTAQDLLDALKELTRDTTEKELDIHATAEVSINDVFKDIDFKFEHMEVTSNHPKKITIHLR